MGEPWRTPWVTNEALAYTEEQRRAYLTRGGTSLPPAEFRPWDKPPVGQPVQIGSDPSCTGIVVGRWQPPLPAHPHGCPGCSCPPPEPDRQSVLWVVRVEPFAYPTRDGGTDLRDELLYPPGCLHSTGGKP